jgi:hypothetical protein
LNRRKRISFPIVYWILFLIVLIIISYSDGKDRIAAYDFTEGVVVDKLFLRSPWGNSRYGGGRRDIEFAQWQYVIEKDTFLFVDKQHFTYNKPLGTKRKIMYLKNSHDEALVSNPLFWFNIPLILIATVVAVFIFGICLFTIHWNDKAWFARWNRSS